jgi:hypothetical protein
LQYADDTFGKFATTVSTIHILLCLETHHLDLAYCDELFKPGAYLDTHHEHLKRWHGIKE